MKKTILMFAAAAAAFACFAEAPLKVAYYVGDGPRGGWAVDWIRILDASPNVDLFFVDGPGVRRGDLEKADVLVMAGGWAPAIYESIGREAGCAKLREFLEKGGNYIGTCAGAYFAQCGGECGPHARIAPVVSIGKWERGERAEVAVQFGERAKELSGMDVGPRKVNYYNGPLMAMSKKPPAGATGEIIARYDCAYSRFGTQKTAMKGKGAVFAGRYGKGRTFLISFHPESERVTHDIVAAAFRYVAGRAIAFKYRPRAKGAIKVGVNCYLGGIDSAEAVRALDRSPDTDVGYIADASQQSGVLDHFDAAVVPDGNFNVGKSRAGMDRFLARGGKIYAWGSGTNCVPPGSALLPCGTGIVERIVGDFKSAPPEEKNFAPGSRALRKVGIYAGEGVDGLSALNLAEFFNAVAGTEISFLDGASVTAGGLDGLDMFVVPSGDGKKMSAAMDADGGFGKIRGFVKSGGSFLAVGNGSRTALAGAGALVPFTAAERREDSVGTEICVRFKEAARKYFDGAKPGNGKGLAAMYYRNGPLMERTGEIDGASAEIVAVYAGWYSTEGPQSIAMEGKGAAVAGRFGKGRVFLFGAQPETKRAFRAVLETAAKYLGRRTFAADYPSRRFGAEVTGFATEGLTPARAAEALRLMNDFAHEVVFVTPGDIANGKLDFLDSFK